MNFQSLLKTNMLVKHLAGSHAYGTAMETSDTDYRGLFFVPSRILISPWFNVEQINDEMEEDTVYYELRKFMKLLVDQNPNIVETLWVRKKDIVFHTEVYDFLRQHRYDLLSSKVAFTYSGYAFQQLKRLKGHKKWINNPMSEVQPRQDSFLKLIHNYQKNKLLQLDIKKMNKGYRLIPYGNEVYAIHEAKGYSISSDNGNLNTTYEGEIGNNVPLMLVKFCKQEYKAELEKWNNYWSWKKNRNAIRSELEEQSGFDTKHGMHLFRLLRMAKEILTTGEVNVFREDADELLAIRNGSLTYDEMIDYAEDMDQKIRNVYYKQTSLRKTMDLQKATDILMAAYNMCWNGE